MKRTMLLSSLSLLLAGGAHAADNSSQSVPISGTVANLCVLGAPSSTSINLGGLINTTGVNAGRLTTISNQSVTLPGSFCNFAGSQVTVSATALTAADPSTVQSGFARAVNYTATASGWAPSTTVATTAVGAQGTGPGLTTTTVGPNLSTPKLNDISLVLSSFSAPTNNLLVAGGYSGSVTVTLAPSAAQP